MTNKTIFSALNDGCNDFIRGFQKNVPSVMPDFKVGILHGRSEVFIMILGDIQVRVAVLDGKASLVFEGVPDQDIHTFEGTPYDAGKSFAEMMVEAAGIEIGG